MSDWLFAFVAIVSQSFFIPEMSICWGTELSMSYLLTIYCTFLCINDLYL
jgi:hypothetical protein